MADRLDPDLTKCDAAQVGAAMCLAWWRLWNEIPARWSILLLLAHSALETAEWSRMIAYSLGGVKSREGDGHDFTFFATSECLSAAGAAQAVRAAGQRVDGAGPDAQIVCKCSDNRTKVKLYPDNAGCRFRAYRTLELAAIDHLAMLKTHKSIGRAWPAVLSGSPESFAKLLKEASYYTAPVEQYTDMVRAYFRRYSSLQLQPSAIIEAATQAAARKEDEDNRDKVNSMVALALRHMVDSMAEGGWK